MENASGALNNPQVRSSWDLTGNGFVFMRVRHLATLASKKRKNKEKTHRLLLRHYACETGLFAETADLELDVKYSYDLTR